MRASVVASMLLAAVVCAVPTRAFADRLILKNGDTLTGTVVTSSAATVVLDSELAGRITIARANVTQIVGPVAGQTTAAAADAAPAAPAGKELLWHGAINAGIDLSRGNAETTNLSTNGVATRLTEHDRLGLFVTQLFSSIGSGADAVTTARATRGGVRYDHDVAGPVFGFGFADLENDPLQLLEFRSVTGGGGGVHLLKNETSQLNLFGGVSFAHDAYSAVDTTTTPTAPATTTTPTTSGASGTGATTTTPGRSGSAPGRAISARDLTRGGTPPPVVRTASSRDVGEFLFGEDATRQLSDAISLDERFTFFPAVNAFTDYRYSLDFSLSAKLSSWLQWNADVEDRYLHIPPAGGAVQNDTFVSTGLGITFGGGETESYTGADGRTTRRR